MSRAWVALRNRKALFCGVFALVFAAGGAAQVMLAPHDYRVVAEVPVAASQSARALAERLSAAKSSLETPEAQAHLTATPSASGDSVRVEARGSSPERAGELITALLRQERDGNRVAALAAAQSDLDKARKERAAVDATLTALQSKLAAIEKENAGRNERNRRALAANTEAERRRSQQSSVRSRAIAEAREKAGSRTRSIEQARDRRRYIGVRIDVLVDEIQGLRARLASTPETVTDVNTSTNAYGQELRLRLEGLLGEREDLVAARGASDPAVKEIDGRIRRMRQRVAQEPAETRVETKRPNPERATVLSRLRARENELAAINSERGQVLSRIASLEATPAPREPAAPPPPRAVAKAVLEPVLDAGPTRARLASEKKKRQEAEAEVQRVARHLRELQASPAGELPTLQYPPSRQLEVRNFLVPLGAALLLSLMAVAAGEIRSRKPAAPATRLRRRRTIEDRSRELIEGPAAEPEIEPVAPPAEVVPAAAEISAPEPLSSPTFAPEGIVAGPPPLRAREIPTTFVPRLSPSTPAPMPQTSAGSVAEMAVIAPPPAYLRAREPAIVNRTVPTEPVPIPDTGASLPPEMAVIAPPPAYLRARESAFIDRPITSDPLLVPDTSASEAPEMDTAAPPPVSFQAWEGTFLDGVLWTEPALIPDTAAILAAEAEFVAPSPISFRAEGGTFLDGVVWTEPALIPDTAAIPAAEAELAAPPLILIAAEKPILVADVIVCEPPSAAPESVLSVQIEAEVQGPPLLAAAAMYLPRMVGAVTVEPRWTPEVAEEPVAEKVVRTSARVRVVRRRTPAPVVEPETQAAPVVEPITEAPPLWPAVVPGPTFVPRTQPTVPMGERATPPLIEAEPVREWVELTPADLVPEDVTHAPEVETDLAREAVFSGQPVTLIEAPAAIAIPAPAPVEAAPVPVPVARPKRVTRPRPLRELASLTRNLNPLAIAHDRSAGFADTEALNRIRQAIEFAECRTLLVCGAHRGDGASHTTLLLAAHLSERGWPVVVVDADFRHRTLHRSLRVPHLPGFSEFLMDLADYREVLQETEYERLASVSAGPLLADPALLLQPMRVDRAIRILRELGALVIIDGGPALSEVQAELLAPFTDGVLLVTRHAKGGGWTLKKANERLQAAQGTVLGLVRNPHKP